MTVGHVLPKSEVEAIQVHADPVTLRNAFQKVASNAFDLFFEKGGDYDIQLPFWHRHPFGDQSYGHELFKKAGRAVSIVIKSLLGGSTKFEGLDEQIDDIINYAIMWRHWRDITGRSAEIVSITAEEGTPEPPVPLGRPDPRASGSGAQ